MAAMQFRPLN